MRSRTAGSKTYVPAFTTLLDVSPGCGFSTKRCTLCTPSPIVSPTNVLILGSDLRAKGTKEPGAATSGPSRSDSIQLMRVGGGHGSKLSIPRDTVVEIPGYGLGKVNAAFAFGGAALSIRTLRSYLGIEINHVIVVNFDKFPDLIDSMGGIVRTSVHEASTANQRRAAVG